MSPPSSTENQPDAQQPRPNPRPDIYTVLLAISLAALILAIIFLYLETVDYGAGQYQGGPMADGTGPTVTMFAALTQAHPPARAQAASPALFV